jgi:hypothetical protein
MYPAGAVTISSVVSRSFGKSCVGNQNELVWGWGRWWRCGSITAWRIRPLG